MSKLLLLVQQMFFNLMFTIDYFYKMGKKLMHQLYSSIISQKFIIIFLNKRFHCIYIKSSNDFL